MASNKEAKVTFRVEASEFTAGIKQMNSSLTSLNKELKLVDAQMKEGGASVEGLRNKQNLLTQQLEKSNNKIEMTRQCLEKAKSIFGENSEEVQKWSNKLLDAQTQNQRIQNSLNKTTAELNSLESELQQSSSAYNQLKSAINSQESEMKQLLNTYRQVVAEQGESSTEAQELKTKISQLNSELSQNRNELRQIDNAVDEFAKSLDDASDSAEEMGKASDEVGDNFQTMGTALGTFAGNVATKLLSVLGDLGQSLFETVDATEEYRTMMAHLESSTSSVGHSVQGAKDKYTELYGYLGDDMAVTNTITNTQKLGLSQDETNAIIDSSVAVWTAYGDSIPIESLTESITETAQVSKVTGNLADALNWAGVSEDEFNKKLEACSTEQERAKLITDTLNGLYGESKKKYDELTEGARENKEAESELMQAKADLANAILPVDTALMNLKTTLAQALTPAIEFVSGKIQELISWFNSLSPSTQDTIIKIGLIVGAIVAFIAIVGAIGAVFSVLTAGFGFVASALGVVAGLFTGLPGIILGVMLAIAVGVMMYWDQICAACQAAWEAIKTAVTTQIQVCKDEAIMIWNAITSFLSACWQGIQNVANVIWTHITTSLSNAWNTIKTTATNVFNTIKTTISNVWNNIKTNVSNAINSVKTAVSNGFNAVKTTASNVWNGIKTTISNAWNSVKSTTTSIINGIKSSVSSGFNSIKSTASSIFNSVKSTISNALNSAKSVVTSALSTIKSKFTSFKPSWSIPKPKLPKVSVSVGKKSIGGISIPYPKFSVSWGWKGGIVQNPMLFNTANGVVGAGDKYNGKGSNAEAILPLDSFYNHLDATIDNAMNNDRTAYAIDRLYGLVAGLELQLDIDGREFTRRAIAPNQGELDNYRNLRNR